MDIVRVAVTNNFNCTNAEWNQLEEFKIRYPDKRFFINSNIKTPQLLSINNHNDKAVITVNPDITINQHLLHKLDYINPNKIGFLRVKWVPGPLEIPIRNLIKNLQKHYTVVITLQRYQSKESLLKHTSLKYYEHSCSRYRLTGKALKAVESYVDAHQTAKHKVYICDRTGQGCSACHQCATLIDGSSKDDIKTLNLSSSGICHFNCPSCYAKALQKFLVGCGKKPIKFNVIMKNKKQAGKTKHIKNIIKNNVLSRSI